MAAENSWSFGQAEQLDLRDLLQSRVSRNFQSVRGLRSQSSRGRWAFQGGRGVNIQNSNQLRPDIGNSGQRLSSRRSQEPQYVRLLRGSRSCRGGRSLHSGRSHGMNTNNRRSVGQTEQLDLRNLLQNRVARDLQSVWGLRGQSSRLRGFQSSRGAIGSPQNIRGMSTNGLESSAYQRFQASRAQNERGRQRSRVLLTSLSNVDLGRHQRFHIPRGNLAVQVPRSRQSRRSYRSSGRYRQSPLTSLSPLQHSGYQRFQVPRGHQNVRANRSSQRGRRSLISPTDMDLVGYQNFQVPRGYLDVEVPRGLQSVRNRRSCGRYRSPVTSLSPQQHSRYQRFHVPRGHQNVSDNRSSQRGPRPLISPTDLDLVGYHNIQDPRAYLNVEVPRGRQSVEARPSFRRTRNPSVFSNFNNIPSFQAPHINQSLQGGQTSQGFLGPRGSRSVGSDYGMRGSQRAQRVRRCQSSPPGAPDRGSYSSGSYSTESYYHSPRTNMDSISALSSWNSQSLLTSWTSFDRRRFYFQTDQDSESSWSRRSDVGHRNNQSDLGLQGSPSSFWMVGSRSDPGHRVLQTAANNSLRSQRRISRMVATRLGPRHVLIDLNHQSVSNTNLRIEISDYLERPESTPRSSWDSTSSFSSTLSRDSNFM